jgi:hypothetical protein
MNKPTLTTDQLDKLNNLIEATILPALLEDICIADMTDVSKNNSDWDDILDDRMNALYAEAVTYINNNL